MKLSNKKLKEILLQSKFIEEKLLAKAEESAEELGKSLSDILIFQGLISEEALGQIIAEYLKVPFVPIKKKVIPLRILSYLPENLAYNYRLVPFDKKADTLSVAMEDPQNFEAIELARRQSGLKIKPFYCHSQDLIYGLSQYKKNIKFRFKEIISKHVQEAGKVAEKEIAKIATELPVIKIFDTILDYAVAENASDVHIEILNDQVIIRFRIDGLLRDIISLPKEIQLALVARVKILSSLKIDEHRLPQDGRFKFKIGQDFISLRVSIIPAFYGENVVMRLLFESARPLSLEELGLTGSNLSLILEEIKQPHGMILVTGPTGSGKTTTLYSILNILNTIKVKICTIEDPIEYGIRRVSQIQVNPKAGLTFANGLRSLVRHDPDIIMVGEIRDQETVEMAIHAALTGHLVLSTLHTNDSVSAIPRLLDMGAANFLVASTVNLVIAQRLVRRLCPACREESPPPESIINYFKDQFGSKVSKAKFYQGQGCLECSQTGYKGRLGIYEVLKASPQICQLTMSKSSASELKKAAQDQGMVSMLEDGFSKAAAGLTSLNEVLRAVKE